MEEKIKTISKYTMNIMAFINAVILELSPVWGWQLDKITRSISILIGLIGLYLVGGKIWGTKKENNEEIGVG
jgi:hypothetical protein